MLGRIKSGTGFFHSGGLPRVGARVRGGGSTTFTLDDATEEDSFPKSKTMPNLESANGAYFGTSNVVGTCWAFPSMLKSIRRQMARGSWEPGMARLFGKLTLDSSA
jgi:hypothetical protein